MPHIPLHSLTVVPCVGRKLYPTPTQISPYRSLTSGRSLSNHRVSFHLTVYPQLGLSTSNRGLGCSTTSCRPPYHSYRSSPSDRLGSPNCPNCSKSSSSDQKRFFLHPYSYRRREPRIYTRVVFGKYIRSRLCSITPRQASDRAVFSITDRVSPIHKWGL